MTLILVEVNTAEPKPEMTFGKPVVRVGREAAECDIVFDGRQYPMVSRSHAEFRCDGGTWYVADLGSSYGVYINEKRISDPQKLTVGGKVQFGTDGPTVVVIWFDAETGAVSRELPASAPPLVQATPQVRPAIPPAAAPPAPQMKPVESWEVGAAPVKPAAPARQIVEASLQFVEGGPVQPVTVSSQITWIGRDPGCDIVVDNNAAMVSRRHAQVRAESDRFVIEDNKSFNGTLVNEQRISAATPLYHNDLIRLGVGGPVLKFVSPESKAPKGASLAGQRAVPSGMGGSIDRDSSPQFSGTMILDRKSAEKYIPRDPNAQPQLMMSVIFGDRAELTIGRGDRNDIRLDGLQISNRHARIVRSGDGTFVEDLKSTNGVYINGRRVTREPVGPHDAVQIGSFLIAVDAGGNVNVFDTRSRTRVDVINVSRRVKDRRTGEQLTLLDSISLSIQPNEFVGVLGPSGAGKSMLLDVMNGVRQPDAGNVLVNNLDVHRHLDSLKQSIGFVPQEDIIHRELTVYRCLYYVAKMRLSGDVSSVEIRQIVDEILDVTGLSERRDLRVKHLSGGQRKRVSIAVELITKPSVIFLDEPTSGLDPAAEGRIMKLFRQIAESGRTVVMTTHAMENVRLFDKIVVLMGGKLAFYGKPDEALKYFNAADFKELYSLLEAPVEQGIREHGETNRRQITEAAAETWKGKFRSTPQYKDYVEKPLSELGSLAEGKGQKKRRLGIFGAVGQWFTLTRRYFEVLLNDKLTLFILLAQAPVIALMTFFVMEADRPRDFVYFVLAIVAIWFGTSLAAREIIREKPVYKRERMVNLGLAPYLASKLFVLGIIVTVQCLLLFVPLKIFDLAGLMPMPGELLGIPQLWAMLLTAAVGIALGLFVSGIVRTSEMATSLVPLILIPQLLFSGLVGVPEGAVSRAAGLAMPAAWSFDTIKRISTLDTLEPEGANPKGKTRGLGLYKYIESENEKTIARAKQEFEEYRKQAESRYQDEAETSTSAPDITSTSIRKVPDDLSGYVTFLHPWMNEVLNQIVLVLMFGLLVIATLIVLRLRDN